MLKIITDSASDLSEELISRYQLHVIPTPVVIDEVDYLDGKTIQTGEFYKILDDTSRDVRTYHINPAMFEEAFMPYAKNGDSVIYLCFSTGIAGTFNAANIARDSILEEYPDFDLTIIDSRCASAGFGLLVVKLLTMLEHGASRETLSRGAMTIPAAWADTAFWRRVSWPSISDSRAVPTTTTLHPRSLPACSAPAWRILQYWFPNTLTIT